ncbi:MAG TPA: S1-like domain-containing RNA-binding protein [Bacillales bacterium]|nr:S1-like domain-containing RNA-binding protein [Bacillales bacterium]
MSKIEAGTVQKLEVARTASFGYFLSNGEEDLLLHETEVEEGRTLAEGEEVEIFVYVDKKGRLAATMTMPKVKIGTFDWVEVVEVKKHLGVFVHIGIKKDMLLSVDDLPEDFERWPQKGDRLYCSLKWDSKAGLLAKRANEMVMETLFKPADQKLFNKEVEATVYRVTQTGSFLVTAEGYHGFVHDKETERLPRLGEQVKGRVIGVKEDGFINVSLMPRVHERIGGDAEKILSVLQQRNGAMPYSDRSHPDDIKSKFGMSKGAFKRALGGLMKKGKVVQEDGWTRLK